MTLGELHMFIMCMIKQVSSNDRCKMFYEYTETLKKKYPNSFLCLE